MDDAGGLVLEVLKLSGRPLSASEIIRALANSLNMPRNCIKSSVMAVLRDGVQWSFIDKNDDNLYSVRSDQLHSFFINEESGQLELRENPGDGEVICCDSDDDDVIVIDDDDDDDNKGCEPKSSTKQTCCP